MSLTKAPFGGKSVVWDHYKWTRIFDSNQPDILHFCIQTNQPGQGISHFCALQTSDKFTKTDFSKPNKTREPFRNHQRLVTSPKNSGFAEVGGRKKPTKIQRGVRKVAPLPSPWNSQNFAPKNGMGLGSSLTFIFGGPRNAYFFTSVSNAGSFEGGFTTYVVWNMFASSGSKDPKTDWFLPRKNRGHAIHLQVRVNINWKKSTKKNTYLKSNFKIPSNFTILKKYKLEIPTPKNTSWISSTPAPKKIIP